MSLAELESAILVPEPVDGELDGELSQPKTVLSKMQAKLANPAVREWIASRRQNIRPWIQFINVNSFGKPDSLPRWSKRLVKNIDHFQSNYVFVFIGLFVYCLLTSPLLLIAMAALAGGCHILKLRQAEKKLVLAGREVPLAQQYAGVAMLSIPLFLIVGASSALFWVIGASFFVIMLHASFFKHEALAGTEEEAELFEVTMDPI
ncbi:prenylated Rab acceptor protein 1-like [Pollicipes pollicipes]|uniref:prenylated Rab acceptor protein 1-like n=1 Tax=Pollicipes pollicipes TaxID=41117 RepID=UPI001884CBA9|nr:prenylated Rab acceptor protein 1-like [Pollicipes pollicipes]XP_037093487.1 prenylated Rab acceptor protein 1-like [Pollicipes pollicipes]